MNLALLSLDTRGGLEPYLALALSLQRAGHEVRLLAPSDFQASIEAAGVRAFPLEGSVEAAVRASGGAAERGSLASTRYAQQQSRGRVAGWMRQALEACRGAEVLVGGVGGLVVGGAVAEKLGVPFIEAHLQPLGPPTEAFPGVLLPGIPGWMGAPGRRFSHWLTHQALWLPFSGAIRAARVEALGLPARARPVDATLPVLYGVSRHVVPPPPSWSRAHFTGPWRLPPGPDFQPPSPLVDFLARGPAPVCIGFGSMASQDARATTAVVLEAVRRAGVRAVLLSGWGGVEAARGDDVLALDSVPHDWLFPRVAGVVHHGGAGTTHAGIRAGVPALVVPFTMDQPFWGSRVQALGVGPPPVPRGKLDVARLSAGLVSLVRDEAQRERARRLGELVRAEPGVEGAVEVLARWAERRRAA